MFHPLDQIETVLTCLVQNLMGANNPNYQVIATDYTSYAVVYSCTNLFFTNISKFFEKLALCGAVC
jgi:hypothetical protein